jgi:lysophospholipase L1-like esterase
VVWDSFALVGAFTNRLLNFDPDHLRAQLQHRQTELAVFTFGGNDMIRSSMTMEQYEQEFRDVVQRVRTARPEAACLIMSPLDHGLRKGSRIVSMPVVPKMVETQRAVARSEGCAFFDTYMAMGGDGSAGRWNRQKPRLVSGDLSHVTLKGQVVIGEMFYRAVMARYAEYRRSDKTLARDPLPEAKP